MGTSHKTKEEEKLTVYSIPESEIKAMEKITKKKTGTLKYVKIWKFFLKILKLYIKTRKNTDNNMTKIW